MAADLHKFGHRMSAVTRSFSLDVSRNRQVSLVWAGVAAAIFSGSVFLHWPITLACERAIQKLGFAAYQWPAAAIFLAVGLTMAVIISRRLVLVGGLWISVNVLVRRLANRGVRVAGVEYAMAGGGQR